MKVSITKHIEFNGQALVKTIAVTGKDSEKFDAKFLDRLWKSLTEKRGKRVKPKFTVGKNHKLKSSK